MSDKNGACGEFRGRIYDSVLDTIGATPIVRLSRLAAHHGIAAELLAKLEFFNPMGSVKDRIGLAMIEALEAEGKIGPETVVVEPTSGNTGIALAFACAVKGYRLVLTMPESMSIERRKMLLILGAEIDLTPARLGMRGAMARADAIVAEIGDAVIPQQFSNVANPAVHRATTAEEIWRDTDGKLDVMIAGVGTGGTVTGCAGLLKERNPDFRMIVVEPEDSAVLSCGSPGAHRIEGIGAGFVPDNLDTSLIDEVVSIANETAFRTAREMARIEGIPVGISSGASVAAALEVSERADMAEKRILIVVPSFAERYLSTPLFDGV
ncbi:MAG: cysteine synthase A [Alphaproteobacteria bacterium]|nr:cysteine synthase A [Alphaproteobacteria bacterium]